MDTSTDIIGPSAYVQERLVSLLNRKAQAAGYQLAKHEESWVTLDLTRTDGHRVCAISMCLESAVFDILNRCMLTRSPAEVAHARHDAARDKSATRQAFDDAVFLTLYTANTLAKPLCEPPTIARRPDPQGGCP